MRVVVLWVLAGCVASCGARSRLEDFGRIAGGGGTSGTSATSTGGVAGGTGGTAPSGGSPAGGVAGAPAGGAAGTAGSSGSGGRPPLPEGGCTQDGFCVVSPELTANHLNDVWGSGSSDVWAVGDGGTIVHFDGHGWQRVASGTVARLFGVSGTSPDDVWFVGENGQAIHYDGRAFDTGIGPGGPEHLIAVHALQPDAVWIATGAWNFPVTPADWGVVHHFDGRRWNEERPAPTPSFFRALWASSPSDIWLTGDDTFHFDGSAWTQVAVTSGTDIWGSTETGVWMPQNDDLWHLEGASLTRAIDGDGQPLAGVWGTSERDLWAVGNDGFIVHDDGSGFRTMTSGTTSRLQAVWGSSPADVWAVGQYGTILHYDGSSWTNVIPDRSPERSPMYTGIWGASDDEQWITSTQGIFEYDGASRVRATGPSEATVTYFFSIWGSARDDVVAVGSAGVIAEYDGSAWTLVADSPTTEGLAAVWGTTKKMVAVGSHTGVARYARTPWQLEPVTGGAGAPLSAIWGATASDIWVGSEYSPILGHYRDQRWENVSGGFARAFWGSSADDVWAIGAREVSHYDGVSWVSEPLPRELPFLSALGGCSATDVWAVGTEGVILHYDGASWSTRDSGTRNALTAVRCSPGGVWVVGDGGLVLALEKRD